MVWSNDGLNGTEDSAWPDALRPTDRIRRSETPGRAGMTTSSGVPRRRRASPRHRHQPPTQRPAYPSAARETRRYTRCQSTHKRYICELIPPINTPPPSTSLLPTSNPYFIVFYQRIPSLLSIFRSFQHSEVCTLPPQCHQIAGRPFRRRVLITGSPRTSSSLRDMTFFVTCDKLYHIGAPIHLLRFDRVSNYDALSCPRCVKLHITRYPQPSSPHITRHSTIQSVSLSDTAAAPRIVHACTPFQKLS